MPKMFTVAELSVISNREFILEILKDKLSKAAPNSPLYRKLKAAIDWFELWVG
jgi:hypothetical protein